MLCLREVTPCAPWCLGLNLCYVNVAEECWRAAKRIFTDLQLLRLPLLRRQHAHHMAAPTHLQIQGGVVHQVSSYAGCRHGVHRLRQTTDRQTAPHVQCA